MGSDSFLFYLPFGKKKYSNNYTHITEANTSLSCPFRNWTFTFRILKKRLRIRLKHSLSKNLHSNNKNNKSAGSNMKSNGLIGRSPKTIKI